MANPFFDSTASVGLTPEDALRAAGLELSPVTRQLYSSPRALLWVNKPNLFEQLRGYAASHGIHDTFADATTINRLLATRDPNDRAIADRMMTESVIRTAKEITGTDGSNFAAVFAAAMVPRNSPNAAQDLIENALDDASPQHPIYNSMRDEYEQLAQRGNLNNSKMVSLRVNMARIRQNGFSEDIDPNSIRINIPEGQARYNINGTSGESRVIIGEAPRDGGPIKTTPIARGTVEAMEMQPTWYIPNSIAQRKGLYDPTFLANLRREYEASGQTGRIYSFVAPNGERYNVDWNNFNNPGVSPFSQPPSPTNPLGAIKVVLGGEFGRSSIRLHDTVASERDASFNQYAQSSGCIRVQNIADVAGALAADQTLGTQNGYANNRDFFAAIMQPGATGADGRQQWAQPQYAGQRIPIQRGINVETTYNTVTWDAQNQRAVVHRDIYRRDAQSDVPSRNAMPQIAFQSGAIVPAVDQNQRQANAAAPFFST